MQSIMNDWISKIMQPYRDIVDYFNYLLLEFGLYFSCFNSSADQMQNGNLVLLNFPIICSSSTSLNSMFQIPVAEYTTVKLEALPWHLWTVVLLHVMYQGPNHINYVQDGHPLYLER